MKKIALIAYREFLQKVRNKTFLLATLLLPIGALVFYGSIIFFTTNDTEHFTIALTQESDGTFLNLPHSENFTFRTWNFNKTPSKDSLKSLKIDAIVISPTQSDSLDEYKILMTTKIGLVSKSHLEKLLQNALEIKRFKELGIDSSVISKTKKALNISYEEFDGTKQNDLKEGISFGLGYGLGLLMYVILTIYGSQVMRGVMEEKTNRIAEVIISSVRPIELMFGKIIGIGFVCLLQFLVWGIFLALILAVVSIFISGDSTQYVNSSSLLKENLSDLALITDITRSFLELPLFTIGAGFLFYFLGGFFLYSALFASVGAAVNEDTQEAQTLMIPIMMPIILSFVLLTKTVNNPNGIEAIVGSMIPFTSPVIMMSRLVFGIGEGVPLWQLIISILILIIFTFLLMFLASKIYRIGILSYGQKPSWGQMLKWVIQK